MSVSLLSVDIQPRHTETLIRVWRFEDAPDELKALSNHGGDEDWLAYVPRVLDATFIPWLEADSGGFGPCDIQKIKITGGGRVFIGAHA